MGIVRKLGFGKKEPFRAPPEATVLRMKIEAESRENFPHLARYKELVREAGQVYRLLDTAIAQKKYAEEAAKLSEDIRKKLDGLADRIRKNARDAAAAEAGGSSGDTKMDILAQKSIRDSAKTLFTDFLEGHDQLSSCIHEARPGCVGSVDASSSSMIRAMTALNEDYFKKHGSDSEIAGLKLLLLTKVADIDRSYQMNRTRLRDKALDAVIERQVERLQIVSRGLAKS